LTVDLWEYFEVASMVGTMVHKSEQNTVDATAERMVDETVVDWVD
jgi:hypothetical protein